MTRRALLSLVFLWALGIPSAASAQGSIAGVVKDPSGAVLPGVTVEASSAVLIEKVRTVATDGSGQYKVLDLRPGTYVVTFSLTGFNTVKREGIELTGSFAATVNADMSVGSVNETVTVSGEAPVVDVQSVTQQRVMSKEVIDAIPNGRTQLTLAMLIPGVNTNAPDVGGANNLALTTMTFHGGSSNDTRVMVDGVSTQNAEGAGQLSNMLPNMGSTQEVTVDYAAGTSEQAYGGLRINLIPKEGGNRFSGSFFGTATNASFQSSNYTQELRDAGLGAPQTIKYLYDVNPAGGGPILRDKLWFYTAARWNGTNTLVPRLYNLDAGDPTRWTYVPDPSRQAFDRITQRSENIRLTWQASSRNKVSFYYEDQGRCWCNLEALTLGVSRSPEAAQRLEWPVNNFLSVGWSSPLTSRLLFEVRGSNRKETFDYTAKQADGTPNFDLISVTDQATGMVYRSMQGFDRTDSTISNAVASLSYVTGSHAFKVGFGDTWATRPTQVRDDSNHISYRVNNSVDAVPNQLTMRATPYTAIEKQKADLGLYAQDRWTLKRLTLNLGVRFDYYNNYFPEEHIGPTLFTPTRDITFPETSWVSWKDITPRLGAAYDIFGKGKTAIKVTLNKYVIAQGLGQSNYGDNGNPARRLATSVTRSWTDANGNYKPDCDLLNLQQQDSRASGGDFCGTVSDLRFGQPVTTTTYDPQTLVGWGTRPYNWEFSSSLQHELAPRVSVNAGYFRRWNGNFTIVDNRSVDNADYSPFSITAPTDSRLPGGGGNLVTGLYNLNPNKVGLVDNYFTLASRFGNQIQHWNGVDLNVNARTRQGVLLQGGLSTGRTTTDNCQITPDSPSTRQCHVETAFLTQVKLLGVYVVPKVDVQVSGTFQSLPGPQILATYNAPNALVQPSLGRPLSGGASNVPVSLVDPGTLYGQRVNQLDVRVAKVLKFGRTRSTVNFDLYNALNPSTVTAVNSNFAVWQAPTAIVLPRFIKIGAQVDF